MNSADFELSISTLPHYEQGFTSLRYRLPDGAGGEFALKVPSFIDLISLRAVETDPKAYGQALSNMIFQGEMLKAWERVRSWSDSREYIRLRLRLDEAGRGIRALKWELLRDPVNGRYIALNRFILLSRYLESSRPLQPHRQPDKPLDALIVVANPHGLERYRLPPIGTEAIVSHLT